MDLGLSGRRILITGGNSGLGAAISRAFAEARASIAINYLSDRASAEATRASLSSNAPNTIAIEGDVSNAEAVERMFQELDEALGGIDVLVNNAGIDGVRAKTWNTDVEAWDKVVDVNLRGAYLCARQALQRMTAQRGGVIINISSVHEIIPWSGYSAYAASKSGLSMMTKTMAQEAAPFGIRVLAIAPGAIATPINADVREHAETKWDLLGKIPMGRIGRPEEVANMAVVLASDLASYVTGATLFVDGGMSNYPEFAHGG